MNTETKFPIIINLIGTPGAGKSTLAAYLFAKLKMLGVNCEQVTEFAKDKVWEENNVALSNQIYIFSKQYYRITRCEDKVDLIITDSPLVLSAFYNRDPEIHKPLCELIRKINDRYNNMYFFVKRIKRYNPNGRLQTERESDEMVPKLKKHLEDFGVNYEEIFGDLTSADIIIDRVLPFVKDKLFNY